MRQFVPSVRAGPVVMVGRGGREVLGAVRAAFLVRVAIVDTAVSVAESLEPPHPTSERLSEARAAKMAVRVCMDPPDL